MSIFKKKKKKKLKLKTISAFDKLIVHNQPDPENMDGERENCR